MLLVHGTETISELLKGSIGGIGVHEYAGGYVGKILAVDLSAEESTKVRLDKDLAYRFLGGRGFGAKLLYDELEAGTDPLSPSNMLILATGPLTGTSAPGSKLSIVSKSPLTGGYADSHVGGHIGPELKYAGYDVLTIKGKSDRPSLLWVDGPDVEVLDASDLWGKGALVAEKRIKEKLGQDIQVLCIGPGGERLVRFACICHASGRQAGRTGMGAVMGSKNLKAIAVRGVSGIRLVDPVAFQEKVLELRQQILENPVAMRFHELGTASHILEANEEACLPTRNYRTGVFEGARAISGEAAQAQVSVRHSACFGCTMACSKWSRDGDLIIEGPEYETLAMLGANCGIDSLPAVMRANQICDDYGIDTISTGNVVAFAIDCYQKGLISDDETDGLELEFGNQQAYFKLIDLIGKRQGVGDILARGVKRAARRFGPETERFAMHSKGLEQSGYETRGGVGQVLGYAVNDRGADHNRIWTNLFFVGEDRYDIEGKAAMVKHHQCSRSAPDILGVCRFVSYHIDFDDYGKLVEAATGGQMSGQDILEVAERVFNLTRVFNTKEGFTRKNDHVPPRVLEEPVPEGPTKGAYVDPEDFNQMLDEFYEISGWDEDGIPTEKKLIELDLPDVAADLARLRGTVERS